MHQKRGEGQAMSGLRVASLTGFCLLLCAMAQAKVSGRVCDYRRSSEGKDGKQVGIPGVQVSVLRGESVIAKQASNQDGFYTFDSLPQAIPLNLRFELPGYVRRPTVRPFKVEQKDLIIDVLLLKENESSALVAARLRERLARKGADRDEEMAILGGFELGDFALTAIIDRAVKLGTPGLRPMERWNGGSADKRALQRLPRQLRSYDQIAESCIKQHAWMAYFQDVEGNLAPVRDPLNTDHDEDWLGLRFTEQSQPRPRLGFLEIIDKANDGKSEAPVSGIQEMLTAALYNTKRFDVIEQKRAQEISSQQTHGVTEPSPSSIIKLGSVLGAQYLVYATVNEWNPDHANRSVGVGGIFGSHKNEAEVSMTFFLTDTSTGQTLFTTTERVRMSDWSLGLAPPRTLRDPIPATLAVRALANKAAFKIATFLRDKKWKSTVVEVKDKDIYINAGSQEGLTPQTRLSVLSVRGNLVDPESHTILGQDLRAIGILEVVSVQPGFSIARFVQGGQGIKRGDLVELASDPAPVEIPPECVVPDH